MKKIFIILIFLILAISLFGQQFPIHTNYLFNKVLYNPAVTGTNGYSSLQASYRNQWTGLKGAPTTYLFSGDTKLNSIPLGLGGYVLSDITGPMNYTGFSGTVAYGVKVSENGILSAGFSLGMYRLSLNSSFNAQSVNDNTLIQAQQGKWMPDAGIGVYYYNSTGLYAGLSVPQVFQTKAVFDGSSNSTYQLKRVLNLLIGKRFEITDIISAEPSILIRAASPSILQADIAAKFHFYDKFWIGGSYRTQDAFTALAGIRLKNSFDIGYAYDFTVSNLKSQSSGSHEVMLAYRFTKASDRDKDGTIDKKDDCPDIPGPRKNKGCPEEKDSDKDGLIDIEDECPYTAGPIENNGCPIIKKEEQSVIDFAIKNLEFELDKDIIMESSKPYLDELAALLVAKNDWNIHLAGHTDNSGEEMYNFVLSKKRSFAVQKYLMGKGVKKDRIQAEYFGEYMPVSTNETPQGRQKNRRVEMKFVFN